MIQRLARWLSGIGLHWFYGDIRITGLDRIPPDGPILVAMNHQNALVDAMLALQIVPRELRITAKATLGDSVAGATLMKAADIIPLSRASDSATAPDPIRNRQSFQAIIDELRAGGAVLVFPEGKSHNDPKLAPLKTGLARAALRAREDGIHGIRIVPIGTTFAEKAKPDTAVVAQIGEAISMDQWEGDDAHRLTDAIAARLQMVSFTGDVGTPHTPVQTHQNILIRTAAWWGRVMHEIPLRIARRQAIRLSGDVGETAMYTMTLGLAAILVSYLIEVSIIWALLGWIVALIFLASLGTGAYWAAYTEHFPERS
jgi:1-acyl-sn-glycerol-3-phosphate acyltransferase